MLRGLLASDDPQNTRRHMERVLAQPDPPEMVALDGTSRGTRKCDPPKPRTLDAWRRIHDRRTA